MKNEIKILGIALSLLIMAMTSSCGGGGNGGTSDAAGSGILAPLAQKYVEISDNRLESENALKKLEKDGFSESAQKEADKIINGIKQKNDALEAEAKSVAEGLKGQNIKCTATAATGLTETECTVYGVKVSSNSANVVLAFAVRPTADKAPGCLFLDKDGKTIGKMKTFVNGDGTLAVIYMITTKNNAESARMAACIDAVSLVTEAEYDAAVVSK